MSEGRDRRFTGRCKRFMVRYSVQVLLLTAASMSATLWALFVGFFLLPGKVSALSKQMETVSAQVAAVPVLADQVDSLRGEIRVLNGTLAAMSQVIRVLTERNTPRYGGR